MTKPTNSSKAANNSTRDFPARGAGYREIGIAAVAAAVRCQNKTQPDDEHAAARPTGSWVSDRFL